MRRLHAATDDATAIMAARARPIWRLAATCRSLRRVLLLRLVQLRTTAMRVVCTKLAPLSCAELAARLDTPPVLTQKGLRHWLLSPAQPEREVNAARYYAELCARNLSDTDKRIISWALAAPQQRWTRVPLGVVPSSAPSCTGRKWLPLLTKMTIVGRNGPLSAMSRAGFRNVGFVGTIKGLVGASNRPKWGPEDPHRSGGSPQVRRIPTAVRRIHIFTCCRSWCWRTLKGLERRGSGLDPRPTQMSRWTFVFISPCQGRWRATKCPTAICSRAAPVAPGARHHACDACISLSDTHFWVVCLFVTLFRFGFFECPW